MWWKKANWKRYRYSIVCVVKESKLERIQISNGISCMGLTSSLNKYNPLELIPLDICILSNLLSFTTQTIEYLYRFQFAFFHHTNHWISVSFPICFLSSHKPLDTVSFPICFPSSHKLSLQNRIIVKLFRNKFIVVNIFLHLESSRKPIDRIFKPKNCRFIPTSWLKMQIISSVMSYSSLSLKISTLAPKRVNM